MLLCILCAFVDSSPLCSVAMIVTRITHRRSIACVQRGDEIRSTDHSCCQWSDTEPSLAELRLEPSPQLDISTPLSPCVCACPAQLWPHSSRQPRKRPPARPSIRLPLLLHPSPLPPSHCPCPHTRSRPAPSWAASLWSGSTCAYGKHGECTRWGLAAHAWWCPLLTCDVRPEVLSCTDRKASSVLW